jgi:hypothetical protein
MASQDKRQKLLGQIADLAKLADRLPELKALLDQLEEFTETSTIIYDIRPALHGALEACNLAAADVILARGAVIGIG